MVYPRNTFNDFEPKLQQDCITVDSRPFELVLTRKLDCDRVNVVCRRTQDFDAPAKRFVQCRGLLECAQPETEGRVGQQN
jgi:hypothetical protein